MANNVYVQIKFAFNYEKDRALIDRLDQMENKTEYIRRLILADMEAENEAKEHPVNEQSADR